MMKSAEQVRGRMRKRMEEVMKLIDKREYEQAEHVVDLVNELRWVLDLEEMQWPE